MKVEVKEGWMKGIVVDEYGHEYTYIGLENEAGHAVFIDENDKWWIESKRNENNEVIELEFGE